MYRKSIKSFCFFPALLIGLVLLSGCIGRSSKSELDWPCWRGANGDGISRESDWDPQALAGGTKVLWTVNLGIGYSNVAIKDDRIYTAGVKEGKGQMYCLDAKTGVEIWRYSAEIYVEMQATPAVDTRYVYGLNKAGILYCLREKNGKLQWKKDLVSEYGAVRPFFEFAGSPFVEGDLVILTANTSGMALNKRTGQLLWSSEQPPKNFATRNPSYTTGTEYSTPVVYTYEGKRYALLSSWKGLSSVDVTTGDLLWLYEWELHSSAMVPDPVMIGNRIYIARGSTELKELVGFLLDIESGKPKICWENSNLWSTIATPVFVDGYIYGCHNLPYDDNPDMGFLRCLNAETGELCWEKDLGHGFTFAAAAGKLIILTTRGMLHIAEATPSSYQEISSGDVLGGERKPVRFWTPPVIYKGKIYCRDYGGELFCIDVRKRDNVARLR